MRLSCDLRAVQELYEAYSSQASPGLRWTAKHEMNNLLFQLLNRKEKRDQHLNFGRGMGRAGPLGCSKSCSDAESAR